MEIDNQDLAALLAKLDERDQIIDTLQATICGMEQQITEDGRRIAELQADRDSFRQTADVTATALIALQDEYKALEAARAYVGLGALALAERRGQTITELVDEKIALRRQLEDTQAERDCYKASFDAADIATKHVAARANELAEQLDYAQATILKQAQRMAHLEAELYDLKAAVAKDAETEWMPVADHAATISRLHNLACQVGHAFRMARVGETTEEERRNREALYTPYEALAKAIDALAEGV